MHRYYRIKSEIFSSVLFAFFGLHMHAEQCSQLDGGTTLQGGTFTINQQMLCGSGTQISLTDFDLLFTGSTYIMAGPTTFLSLIATKTLSAQVDSVDWAYTGSIIALGSSDPAGPFKIVELINGALVERIVKNFNVQLYHFAWHPHDYYLVSTARTRPNGFQVWYYDPVKTTMTLVSASTPANGYIQAVAWHPSGNYLAAGTSATPEVKIYSFNNGVLTLLTSLDVNLFRIVQKNALAWDPSGKYLAVGFDVYTNQNSLAVFKFDGSTVKQVSEAVLGQTVSAIDWSPTGSQLVVGLASGSERLRVYDFDTTKKTLTEKTASRIGESLSVLSVDWSASGNHILVGRVQGTDTELRVYSIDAATGVLTLVHDYEYDGNILATSFSPLGELVAVGDAQNNLMVYEFARVVDKDTLYIVDLHLNLESDLSLDKHLLCKGYCAISGQGRTIDIASGAIIVAPDSTLFLQDTQVKNIGGVNFCCLDGLSTMSLRNVTLILNKDSAYPDGKLDIVGETTIKGPYIFRYQSDGPCTIASGQSLVVEEGATLSFMQERNKHALAMSDRATLWLVDATLHASDVGIQMYKGTLGIDGDCYVMSDAHDEEHGITLGDGLLPCNNVNIKFSSESGLTVKSGYLVYKNVAV